MSGTSRSENYDQPQALMKHVQSLLIKDKRTFPQLYVLTGIHYNWLSCFATGQYKNPSVNRVQFLYEFLSGKELSF